MQPEPAKKYTKHDITELLLLAQRETMSKHFGDNLIDFIVLGRLLGKYKLTRIQASELNIYSRGGVTGIYSHLTKLKDNGLRVSVPKASRNNNKGRL